MITFDAKTQIFQIDTDNSSYVMQVHGDYLLHLHWGAKVGHGDHSRMLCLKGRASFSPSAPAETGEWSTDSAPFEYPVFGTGDLRTPACHVRYADGSTASELRYAGHRIYEGKPMPEGLPRVWLDEGDSAQTLEITLKDDVKGLEALLSYSVVQGYEAIVRSVRLVNRSGEDMTVLRCMSAALDVDCGEFDEIHLHGAWARERWVERTPVTHGVKLIESRRGASSHALNPFFALAAKDAGEHRGEVYGFSLIYSGNFAGVIERDQYSSTRAMLGISPFDFAWKLSPGRSFQSPEAVLVYSEEGIGGMSWALHRLYDERLCRGQWHGKPRPVLVNNWEATYFDFDEAKLVSLAAKAAELGIEMLVMDDGWFGRRNDDKSSLGDWFENREKLPGGLKQLVTKVKAQLVKFGIWFEPEMISPDSDLYRAHPDWCIHIPERRRTTARNQLVLNMARAEVCDYIVHTLSDILSNAPIDYVKWDFNRNLTEVFSPELPADRQGEVAHRYMLGTYHVLEELTSRFPAVLFEGCSGGGGRFDPGMLYYTPQIWTSDDTDAVERIRIQYGTSFAYPLSMMSAHVSVVPNHQCGRVTPFDYRGAVAMTGAFGYELDLEKMSAEDCAAVTGQIANYKAWNAVITGGRLHRLRSPFEGTDAAWMFVSPDRQEALVFYFCWRAETNTPVDRLRLMGLDAEATYREDGGETVSGAELMAFGLFTPEKNQEYTHRVWHFRAQ